MSNLIPLPSLPITIRPATMEDLPFIDALQKAQSRAVGWLPTKALAGKIERGEILIADGEKRVDSGELIVDRNTSSLPTINSPLSTLSVPVGYLIASDRYLKRDELGVIYAINIVPAYQRSLVAATLLQAQFDRSPRGCKLYCCWCAQDLAANRFWEAMGFRAIAFRTGGKGRGKVESGEFRVERNAGSSYLSTLNSQPSTFASPRTHLFWQKRIRGDATPWWYPSETGGGAIRENRLVLPIPPGVRWTDAMPTILPHAGHHEAGAAHHEPRPLGSAKPAASRTLPDGRGSSRRMPGVPTGVRALNRPAFAAAADTPVVEMEIEPAIETTIVVASPKREKRSATKNDPALVKRARDLRDRWFEHVNGGSDGGSNELPNDGGSAAKYALATDRPAMIDVAPIKRLAA